MLNSILSLLLAMSAVSFAVEPTTCEHALRAGALPWRTLRRVRELALAYVQVAHQVGSSDLDAPRIVVFPDAHAEGFAVWAEVTDPKQFKHFVHLVLNEDFRVVLCAVRPKPDNQGARALADWDKFERQTANASDRGTNPRRLAMVFVGADGPVATLEARTPVDQFASPRQFIPLKDLPDTAAAPSVRLSPARQLAVESESLRYVEVVSPGARLVQTDFLRELPGDPDHTRVEVGVRVRWPDHGEDRYATFWVLIDRDGNTLVDLNDEPGEVIDFGALRRAARQRVPNAAFGETLPDVLLVRTGLVLHARVGIFNGLRTTWETYEVNPQGDFTRVK